MPKAALRAGVENSYRLQQQERDVDLALRHSRKHLARDERLRQPLEAVIEEIMLDIGKPLPVPVVAREISLLLGVYPEAVRDRAGNVLISSRFALEATKGYYLHRAYTLDATLPTADLVIRENSMEDEDGWEELQDLEFPAEGTWTERASNILREISAPLSHKMLGYLLWKSDPRGFNLEAVTRALGDRTIFLGLVGGLVTLQEQVPLWRQAVIAWGQQLSGAAVNTLDIAAVLRQRGNTPPVPPKESEIEELKSLARATNGLPVEIAPAAVDVLDIDPRDPNFPAILHGLNDALRRDPAFLPVGIGKFLLREMVPTHVGEVPAALRPVTLDVRSPETGEPLDIEMSDDGLEGEETANFVHDQQWEDIGEEFEVKLRRAETLPLGTEYLLLDHHRRAGTLKLRRQDEDFFEVGGPLTRLPIRAHHEDTVTDVVAWASRESGLIYGLNEWLGDKVAPSGTSLHFWRDELRRLNLNLEDENKEAFIDEDRYEALTALRESAAYLSLFDLLQKVMAPHENGAELPLLWAEVNVVRRTSKRLLCSVLSGYHCFYFKQKGQQSFLWRFDSGRLDQGFKRNKRKFVRK